LAPLARRSDAHAAAQIELVWRASPIVTPPGGPEL
jgi:hypothetical protein